MKKRGLSIIQALDSADLLRPALGAHPETWAAWRTFHKVVHGLPLDQGEIELFKKCTTRATPPTVRAGEAFGIIGRRGGKSFNIALEAVHACLIDDFWHGALAPGERAFYPIIACDRLQARIILYYVKGIIQGNPLFASQVENETAEEIVFRNRSVIQVKVASFRSVRGPTYLGAACDEIAFWRDAETSANPASEVLDAIRPGIIPGGILFGISSAYARQGLLFDEHQEHFGKESETLVWLADTLTMNPTFSKAKIDRAMKKDAAVALAEYYSQFRDDLTGLFSRTAIEAAIIPGRMELPPVAEVQYYAFCDPSGGRHDSFTLAVSHESNGKTVVDLLREVKAPFQPAAVTKDFAAVLKRYGLFTVTGDRYAGEWPREAFQSEGITYQVSEKTASELYIEMIPRLSNGEIELPENDRLFNQLLSLLRRTGPGGKDSVITPQGSDAHADLANACAGAITQVSKGGDVCGIEFFDRGNIDDEAEERPHPWSRRAFFQRADVSSGERTVASAESKEPNAISEADILSVLLDGKK